MRKRRALAAAVLLAAAACSRCGGARGGPGPERFLPADVAWAVVVPRLRTAEEQLGPLLRTVLTFPAAAGLSDGVAAVRAQLGFDPLDPAALADAGIDPERGAALGAAAARPTLLVLPVKDARRVDALVGRIARDRLGAALREPIAAGNVEVVTFRAGPGAPPALALAVVQGSALVAAGADGPSRLAAAAALPAGDSLAQAAPFGKIRAALGGGPAVIAYAPAGSAALRRAPVLRDGAAIGIEASSTRVAARGALLLAGERAAAWADALGAASSADALSRLPSDAFLVARSGADPGAAAARLVRLLPARAAGPLQEAARALAPGGALALSLAPSFEVAAVSRGAAVLSGRDVFRLVHLAAVLPVKPATADSTLGAVSRAATAVGFEVAPRPGAVPGLRLRSGATELDVALDGDRLLVGGGPGRLEALATPPTAAFRPPTADARAALERGGAGAVLDLDRLVSSFRALPPEAYGSGPDAFVMRSLAERVIDPAARLTAASLHVELVPGVAVAELIVEAHAPEGASR